MADIKRVLQENVVRGNQAGRIVELTDGKKVFLVGNTSGKTSGSNSSSGSFNVQSFIDDQFKNLSSSEDKARQLEKDRESRLQQFVDPVLASQRSVIEGLQGRSNLEDLYKSLSGEMGIGDQQGRIKDLGQQTSSVLELLRQLPDSVGQRTAGTFTTQAQRQAIEAKERQPLANDLQSLGNLLGGERTGLSEALNEIARQLGLRQTQEARALEPVQTQLTFAGQNLDRARGDEATRLQNLLQGFTSDQGNILSKITSSIGGYQDLQRQDQERIAAEIERVFSASENDKTRQFNAGESDKSRAFTASESAIGRSQEEAMIRLREAISQSSGGGGSGSSSAVQAWVDEILAGNAAISNVPANLKNAVISAIAPARAEASSNTQSYEPQEEQGFLDKLLGLFGFGNDSAPATSVSVPAGFR